MSSTSTQSVKSANGTASSHDADERHLWDQETLNQERAEFEQWANIGTTVTQNIFVPDAKHCGVWDESPNKARCASFGDCGTTASVSCYGDLIQMSQYLDVGHSGVFTIEQEDTPEPYQVADRAKHLDDLATNMGSKFSFLLIIPDNCCPDEDDPPEVRWVNWRWPRYQYVPENRDIKCCYQFMVHDGVVLQQFTLENTTASTVEVGPFEMLSKVLIRDLDFLDESYRFNDAPESEKTDWSDGLGPDGYGHVYVHMLPGHGNHCEGRCSEHAVASVTTTFFNGSAVQFQPQDKGTRFLIKETVRLGGTASGQTKAEIVLARKLFIIPNSPTDWRNFIISKTSGDINHWLRKEKESLGLGDDERISLCLAKLPMTMSDNSDTDQAKHGGVSRGANEEKSAADLSEGGGYSNVGPQVGKHCEYFNMPKSTPKSAKEWDPSHHLEYFAWRHLEHILSVYAMPLSTPRLIEPRDLEVAEKNQGISPPVALTCGDMSGHRINTSASFFAFQFLVDVARRLRLLEVKTKHILSMERRIEVVCSGHIRWLQQVHKTQQEIPIDPKRRPPYNEEALSNDHILQIGCFAANYWVTGKVMDQDSNTWQPQNRMTDTAFQILKLAEYQKLIALKSLEKEPRSIARDLMQDIYVPWLTELDRLDIRKSCSWPHSNMKGIVKFRLDDHFWIWRAIKSLFAGVAKLRLPPKRKHDEIKLEEEYKTWLKKLHYNLEPPTYQKGMSDEEKKDATKKAEEEAMENAVRKFMEIAQRLSPNNVQRNVLQRFTAENDVLKSSRRMLAVTRSAIDIRFLLHSRDTALFNDQDGDFFTSQSGSSFTHLWQNTIDAQLDHEESVDADSTALRHALGILMGIRSGPHSNTGNDADLGRRSFSILIGSSGSDGFFPGQLDEEGRGPDIFEYEEDRDRFYHAGFEVNYILFSRSEKINQIFSTRINSPTITESYGQGSPSTATVPDRPKAIDQNLPSGQVISGTSNKICGLENHPLVLIKKSLPFTNAIPATNVNYIGDEWLYRYPEFLRGQEFGDPEDKRLRKASATPKTNFSALCKESFGEAASQGGTSDTEDGAEITNPTTAIHVVDVGKRRAEHRRGNGEKSKKYKKSQFFDGPDLCKFLNVPRTAWTAKKRFVWLPHASPAAALACCLFIPETEQNDLRRFFERHSSHTKDVLDETSMALNYWQTELYLSFYLLVDDADSAEPGSDIGLPDWNSDQLSFFKRPDLQLRRASMSFRFHGDFFDRFWTCHFVEHNPTTKFRGKWDHSFRVRDGNLDKEWSQRKVLELYLLNRIVHQINDASGHFEARIRNILGIRKGSLALAELLPEVKLENMQRFEKILLLVEEDLTANLATLREKWNRRDTDRGGEKPRWTRNDEARYRTAINKFRIKAEREIGNLEANRDNIRKLKDFLATTRKNRKEKRDEIRTERDRLRDADIRYFTYVTIIFQPLAFAASFYTMGGAPEPALIISLVEFSAAAFAVTLVLIWTYRLFASHGEYDDVLRAWSDTVAAKSITKLITDTKDSSLQRLVHRIGLAIVKMVNYFLGVLHWCWVRIYRLDKKAAGGFPSFDWDGNKDPKKENGDEDVERGHPQAT